MRFRLYRIADDCHGWTVGINRVCGHMIGVYANLGAHCASFVWRKATVTVRPVIGTERTP